MRLLNMINYSEKDGCLTFQVYVVPRASRSEIAGEHNGALRVRLAAAPVDGAANRELIAVLAKALRVSRSAVEITAGHTSKTKRVTVTEGKPEILNNVIAQKAR
ncbi:MAG TPA: DUF167 domain-containing protein [Pyrinomonadaceae bacterium]|nr:DUF167 domain-containing protein [Pyrinomonadaceae bacterium]